MQATKPATLPEAPPGERAMPMRPESLSRAGWTVADQLVVSLGNFLVNVQLARALPASEYGIFALLLGATFLIQSINVALLIYPLSMRVAASPGERDAGLTSSTLVMVAASNVVLALVLAAAAIVLGRADLTWAAVVFSVLWQVQDSLRRGLMAEFRHRAALIGDALTYLGQAALVLILARRGEITLVSALLAIASASAIGAALQLWQLGLPRPDLGGLGALLGSYWSSGRWAVVSALLTHVRTQIFPWILGIAHGPAATAGFQASANLANVLNPVLFGICNAISQATAQSKARAGMDAAWRTMLDYGRLGAPVVIGYALVVLAAPAFMLSLFYGAGSPYGAYETAVRLIVLAAILNYVADAYSAYLYGTDNGRLAFRITVVSVLASLAGAAVLAGSWGVAGAAGALLATNVVRLVSSHRSRHETCDHAANSQATSDGRLGAMPAPAAVTDAAGLRDEPTGKPDARP